MTIGLATAMQEMAKPSERLAARLGQTRPMKPIPSTVPAGHGLKVLHAG